MKLAIVKPRWESPDPGKIATGSYGPLVEKWAKANLNLELDAWQSYALRQSLRHQANGDLVYRTVLIGTARQNGKSVLVRVLYGWLLTDGRNLLPFSQWSQILSAASDAHQARIPYQAVWFDLGNNPALLAKLSKFTEYRGIRGGNLTYDTITGQPGAARGRSAGLIAFDELQEQRSTEFLQAIKPIQSAQRSPLLFCTATAGHSDSVVLKAMYDRLKDQVAGTPDPTFYGLWFEAQNTSPGLNWNAVQQANPSYPGRISKETIDEEYRSLPFSAFLQERLNVFATTKAQAAINEVAWKRCHLANPLEGFTGQVALGVDIEPGWLHCTIAVAGKRSDGRIGIEIHRSIKGTEAKPITADQIVKEIDAFCQKHNPMVVAYDFQSGADSAFVRHAADTGYRYDRLGVPQIISACMDVHEQILSTKLAVNVSPLLDSQIPNVAKRLIGKEGAFRYSRAASTGPIDGVLAMTYAAHAISFQQNGLPIF